MQTPRIVVRSFASRSVLPVVTLLAVLVASQTGCRRPAEDDGEDSEASATTTSALQAQADDGLTSAVVDAEGTVAPGADDAARLVADLPLRGFRPAGCAKKTREGNVVTLTVDGCTGPLGQVSVVGTLVATFSNPSPDVLRVDVATGPETTTNGDPLSYTAQADARFEGTKRFVTYHGSSRGTTKRGKPFQRATDLDIVADIATHCGSIDGTSKGSVGAYDLDLTIAKLEGCRDRCPSGGSARATLDGPFVKNASVEVTFDGSDEAHVAIDRGEGRRKTEHEVKLDCAAGEAVE